MPLKEKISRDLKEAMRARQELRISVLRMLLSAIHGREIEKRSDGKNQELTEEEIEAAIRSEAKKRKEAIREFERGGREDLRKKEAEEFSLLETYLPPEASGGEIEAVIDDILSKPVPREPNQFGRIMGEAMKRLRGKVSGERVAHYIRKKLDIQEQE
jgi:uncharacterized protein YqeY